MCGICGYWTGARLVAADEQAMVARRMADTLRHRGPDDAGVWVDEDAGLSLGHRRLSILDLSPQGHQPMVSGSGRFVLSYNGEIYNFASLRRELESAGAVFRGRSDTEVLLAGIEQWGLPGTLERAEGMFALALWDRRARTLSLARDRAGKKPLYYGHAGRSFVFASELKALHVVPGFTREIDREALGLYLQYGWVPAPRTIYRGIRQLQPGTTLTLQAPRDGAAAPEAYWSARAVCEAGRRAPFTGSLEAAADRLEGLLRTAVAERMVADVPLGALLSGGVDSSLVVALMQAQSSRPVRTFTIGFSEQRYDEAAHARTVAGHLGTEHTELYMTPADALGLVPRLADLYDEPFADNSALATALVCRLAREHVTVALTGDGGDELFAGYRHYADTGPRWHRLTRRSLWQRRLEADGSELLGRSLWALDRACHAEKREKVAWGAKLVRQARALQAEDAVGLYLRRVRQRLADPAEIVVGGGIVRSSLDDRALPADDTDIVRVLRLFDFSTWLVDDILVKVDRASMAVGLEARSPLLDHRVGEFAWSLPTAMLIGPGGGKRPLRAILDRYVPRQLTERPKAGFVVPLRQWLKGPLRDWAETLLDPARVRQEGLLRPEAVTRAWRQLQTGWDRNQGLVWSILVFQLWRERWQAG
jgi:asparagine synthase (glutamine-hydrolysing)